MDEKHRGLKPVLSSDLFLSFIASVNISRGEFSLILRFWGIRENFKPENILKVFANRLKFYF